VKLIIAAIIAAIGCGWCWGYASNTTPVQTIEVPSLQYHVVKIPVTKTITETVTDYIYLDELRQFESRQQLVEWLSNYQKEWVPGWNCVDYSYDLARKAQYDGYLISTCVLTPSQYDSWFGTENIEAWWGKNVTHMVNSVVIEGELGREYYFIDSSASLIVWPGEGYYGEWYYIYKNGGK